jgi:tetratricopeptide (TPR) repeat protein
LESILPAYSDPLFSILLIVVIALIISLMTYAWGLYQEQREEEKLQRFLEKFESAECSLDSADMAFDMHMLKPLSLLAKAFENVGEYQKAINIYLYLIKHIDKEVGELELMQRLGKTYLHAGFLERARSIYTEILRRRPRNIEVLYNLGVVYEMMHNYPKAKEILTPLRLLGEDTHHLEAFFDLLELLESPALDIAARVEGIVGLCTQEPQLYRQAITALLRLDVARAWEMIDPSRIKELLDILWFLPNSQLDLAIISSSETLHTLYYAKGYLSTPKGKSGIFSIDMLATARAGGLEGGDLLFSYVCRKCKQSFPVAFTRCPSCTAINTVSVEERVVKATPQTSYSLL